MSDLDIVTGKIAVAEAELKHARENLNLPINDPCIVALNQKIAALYVKEERLASSVSGKVLLLEVARQVTIYFLPASFIANDLRTEFELQFKALDELVEAKENANEAKITSVIGLSFIAILAILIHFQFRNVSVISGSIAFL